MMFRALWSYLNNVYEETHLIQLQTTKRLRGTFLDLEIRPAQGTPDPLLQLQAATLVTECHCMLPQNAAVAASDRC
ncbi:hypothetical protein AAFF_G00242430 [Aldrovandia affinis]|uniref:Uncharacterized protein n=1 Tax=Aldrovandia affinis TaxID=143900 RepID=A0AAD7W3W2_9TELE|nr:hypothetical protein AAFF_G00242430 [Aldrovandia affinis]